MFGKLYCTAGERKFWGDRWIAGELQLFPHGEWVKVARFDGTGDGVDVIVSVEAFPARFYRIAFGGMTMSTGSGMRDLIREMAIAVSDGMLEYDEEGS